MMPMLPTLALRAAARSKAPRCFSTFYSPTLVERRQGEAGRGGRCSEAGVKVALFGASGFLGQYVCAELGMLLLFATSEYSVILRGVLLNFLAW